MERKIELKLVNNDHYWMKGIYLIRIGRLRYVGKALVVGSRIYQHQGEINRTLAKYSHIVNFVPKEERKGKYVRIAQYLHENPKINHGTVEVLERQVCSMALHYSEHKYLREVRDNSDFCNGIFHGTKPKKEEDNLWDVNEIKQSTNWRKHRLAEWAKRVLGDNPTPEMRKAVVEYQMRELKRILSS